MGCALGAAAAVAMVVVGCQSITDGAATLDGTDVPLYRASVSSSSAASASSSAAREFERQAKRTQAAVHTACDALSTTSVDAIGAVNGYVTAYNENAPDLVERVGPAVVALDASAAAVSEGITELLTPELAGALTEWVDASRALAAAISADAGMSEFNAAIDRVNGAQDAALDLCDAAY